MHGDGTELLAGEEKRSHTQHSTPNQKKHKDRPLKERRHSFKNAVVQHPDLDSLACVLKIVLNH